MVFAASNESNGRGDPASDVSKRDEKRYFTVRDLLVTAFYHRRIIIIAALVPMFIGMVLAITSSTQYTSTSLLMVLDNREYSGAQNVIDSGPAILSIEGLKSVEAEVLILESAEVIRATITEIGADKLFPSSLIDSISEAIWSGSLPEADQDLERFRKKLRANVQSGSNVILASFTHPDRAIATHTIDTLVRNYMVRRKVLFDNPVSVILVPQVEQLETRLRETDAAIQMVMASANVIEMTQDLTLAANQADSILQRWRQIQERRRAVDGQLQRAQEQYQQLSKSVFDFRQLSNEASLNGDIGDLLVKLRVERQTLLSQYAPNHPRIKEIDAKIAVVLQSVKSPEERIAWTERDIRNPSASFINNMVISLTIERDALKLQLQELEEQKKRANIRIDELREAESKLHVLQRDRAVLTESYREYVKRAEAARIEETASAVRASNVRVIQSGSGDIVSRNMALPFLAAGILAGILSGIAAGVGAAELRAGFIRHEDAERSIGLPELATFSESPEGFRSLVNEQAILSLVTRLMEIRLDGLPLSSIQLVDVHAPEDASALTKAMALELSRGRKLRTLVIGVATDDPLERINAHNVKAHHGILVTKTNTPNLDIGEANHDSPLVDLRTSGEKAREAIIALHADYDMVVVSYPAASIHLVRRLACAVDANVLVVRAEHSRGPVATWIRDNVFDAGGGFAGFIFTGRKFYLPEWIYRWL